MENSINTTLTLSIVSQLVRICVPSLYDYFETLNYYYYIVLSSQYRLLESGRFAKKICGTEVRSIAFMIKREMVRNKSSEKTTSKMFFASPSHGGIRLQLRFQ